MRKLFFISATFLLLSFTLHSQSLCEGYMPFEQDLVFEQSHYDAKGKLSSVTVSQVQNVETTAEGFKGLFSTRVFDDKGKEIGSGSYEAVCKDGVVHLDASNVMNPAMLDAYRSMEMTISGDGLQFPAQLAVGQKLPDGNTKIDVSSSGLAVVSLSFNVTDRTVEAAEKIQTSAGAFDCFKLRETTNYQAMFLKRTYTTVSWYAKNVGLVKQETYDHKGKLSSSMELTRFEKE
jgi:hypothetical protein